MKIDLNKDFETHYKPEGILGLSKKESVYAVIALILAAVVAALIKTHSELQLHYCIYLSLPSMALVLPFGLVHFQEQTCLQSFQELRFFWKTQRLSLQMEERTSEKRLFTMERVTKTDHRERKGRKQ